uniref:Nuclease-associated modular DNA-binding 1 domain-containing protein n=1 Tax=viral metagenome TaxID=1070528 RepID=A0A6M3LRR8_9ZZZZ
MDKEIVVNRITRDMKMSGLIAEDCTEDVKFHLGLTWVAGWEQARMEFAERTEKPVTQYDAGGHKMEDFDSIEKAARQMKCSRETIARAIRTGRRTSRGHIWKFAEE